MQGMLGAMLVMIGNGVGAMCCSEASHILELLVVDSGRQKMYATPGVCPTDSPDGLLEEPVANVHICLQELQVVLSKVDCHGEKKFCSNHAAFGLQVILSNVKLA